MSYDGYEGLDQDEVKILIGSIYLVLPIVANAESVDYVRLVRSREPYEEIARWVCDEWSESPQEVMGAIMGLIVSHNSKPICPYCGQDITLENLILYIFSRKWQT
ncbi:MAG: hypothetical protein ACE5H1_08545 [Thermodesulfobacteriota bacterium]